MDEKEVGRTMEKKPAAERLTRSLQRKLRQSPIKVKVRLKHQITLPGSVAEALRVDTGDELEFSVNDRGEVVLRGYTSIPTDQAWFFTPAWSEGEREASEQIADGQTTFYENVDALFVGLAADDDPDGER
jgi:antitoxin PrlF